MVLFRIVTSSLCQKKYPVLNTNYYSTFTFFGKKQLNSTKKIDNYNNYDLIQKLRFMIILLKLRFMIILLKFSDILFRKKP